tara:strand:- start:490 stop:735 length:246 start_codon:yes stop_codon:yes gene_type:complete
MLASQERAAVRQHYGSARLHAEPKVLADLNLTFPRNQTVALVEGERVRSIHLHAGDRVGIARALSAKAEVIISNDVISAVD